MTMQRKQLLRSASALKGLGFRVFLASDQESSWGYFSDGKRIGYFQQCEWGDGVELATVNKIPGSSSQHLLLETEGQFTPLGQLTRAAAEDAFRDYPRYFDEEDRQMMPVIKYNNVEEFLRTRESELKEFLN